MKPLEQLNNVERAKLLHELFPGEIPAFLKYVRGMSMTVAEEQGRIAATWNNGLITFDFWLSLAQQAEQKIIRYGAKLEKNSRLFADQLFDGYSALYLSHCLHEYTKGRKHTNEKFELAVELLFGYPKKENDGKSNA